MRQVLLRNVSALGTAGSGVATLDGTGSFLTGFFGLNQILWPLAGTFNNLYTHLENVPGTGDTRTLALRVNGSNSALATVHGAADQTLSDVIDSVTVAAGDLLQLHSDLTGSPAASGLHFAVEFESLDAYSSAYGTNVGSTTSGFVDLFTGRVSATADDCKRLIPCAGSITTLMGTSTLNNVGGSVALNFYLYKNGVKQDGSGGTVDTRLEITGITAGDPVTATFDLPVARGDEVYVGIEIDGSYPATYTAVSMVFEATVADQSIFASIAGNNPSDTSANYVRMFGDALTTGLYSGSSTAFGNSLRCGVSQVTLSALILEVETDPGAGNTRTFEVLSGTTVPTDTPIAVIASGLLTVSDSNTVAFETGDEVGPMRHTPASTPTVTGRDWWSIVMGAVPPPPDQGGEVPAAVNPPAAVISTAPDRIFARIILPGASPRTEQGVAETTLNDPEGWFGGPKAPWLLECSPIERRLSDKLDGVEVRLTLADPDRWLRNNMVAGATVEVFTVDDVTRYALDEPYRRFAGIVVDHAALEGFRYALTCRDILSEEIADLIDAPRVPPGRLTLDQFPGMEAEYEGKAIPIVVGVCSDELEPGNISSSPQGVVPPIWVGEINLLAAFGGGFPDVDVLAGFWTAAAIAPNAISQVYFNTIDDPYQRIPVPSSAWGTIAITPGFPGWTSSGFTADYVDYPLPAADGTHRFVPFFILLDPGYGQYVKDGRVLIAANMYGVTANADGTGDVLSDAPRIYQWLLTNMLFEPYEYGAYAGLPTLAGGYSVINTDSVELATTRLAAFGGGSYNVGFMLGKDGEQKTLRHVLEELCAGVLMEQGIDRHGRIMLDVEDTAATPTASFSALHDIEAGSWETWIDRQGYANTIEYLHGRRYVPPVAPVPAPPEGETLPAKRQEFAEWTSGLQRLPHTAAIAANGGKVRVRRVENFVVRSPLVAANVYTRLLDRAVGPSPQLDGARMCRFTVPIGVGSQQGGVDVDLGSVVAVTHLDGFEDGLEDAPVRVLRIVDDIQRGRRTIEGRILYESGGDE